MAATKEELAKLNSQDEGVSSGLPTYRDAMTVEHSNAPADPSTYQPAPQAGAPPYPVQAPSVVVMQPQLMTPVHPMIQQQPMMMPDGVQVIHQPVYMTTAVPFLGHKPCLTVCPSCHEQRITHVKYISSTKTHIVALIMCVTIGCCCIPYLIDTCKQANHYCSNCGTYLGNYEESL